VSYCTQAIWPNPLTPVESTHTGLANPVHAVASVTRPRKFLGGVLLASLAFLLATTDVSSHSGKSRRRLGSILDSPRVVAHESHEPGSLPSIVFWAWERPEDFRFLDGSDAAVAFLAKTIILPAPGKDAHKKTDGPFLVRPRLQPLRVSSATPLIAVVRIETTSRQNLGAYSSSTNSTSAAESYSTPARELIASEIAELQNLPGIRAIQMDYDATVSEREFYTSLLSDVRGKVSASIPLSITALASWCIGDPWLEHLPPGTIQEAVAMLFRMGPDSANVAKFLRAGKEFPVASCRGSLGLSTDEPLSRDLLNAKLPNSLFSFRQKRIYVFSPRRWTAAATDSVLQKWQP